MSISRTTKFSVIAHVTGKNYIYKLESYLSCGFCEQWLLIEFGRISLISRTNTWGNTYPRAGILLFLVSVWKLVTHNGNS
ncbi:hypothetical protein PILCRDRAFT_329027 [Piloderma croceum F 1598]|uniref:Uncharacterized protein n=1 Tax=Piloderma croceum (strain F 1598) TaxID=765440 RepID=A0A0C3C884_PILCF|nr:hypothetical protein PILCRDRAFT_329027 [Piloderma croceum F 1598]